MMIQRNHTRGGHVGSMGLGVCNIVDGAVRVLSVGILHSTFALDFARWLARRRLLSRQQKCDETNAFLRSKLKATNEDTKKILTAAGAVYEKV